MTACATPRSRARKLTITKCAMLWPISLWEIECVKGKATTHIYNIIPTIKAIVVSQVHTLWKLTYLPAALVAHKEKKHGSQNVRVHGAPCQHRHGLLRVLYASRQKLYYKYWNSHLHH